VLHLRARYRVPARLDESRSARSARQVTLPVDVSIRVWDGIDRIDFALSLDNTAEDHRLRAFVRAPFGAERFAVESAFEVAERPIAPEREAPANALAAERPIGAVPQRGFATLEGGGRAVTVAGRGASEVDAVPEPGGSTSLALTLLRAVGWLSRADLFMRPMHAGPPFATPGAQVPGRHDVEFSLRWHAPGDPARTAEAHRFAHPPIAVQEAGPSEAPLADGARLVEVDDPELVVSAVEPRDEGGVVVRVYNASSEPRPAAIRFPGAGTGAGARALEPVDLLERPLPEGGVRPGETLRPWQIVSWVTRG
jgi:mannosylglycerate hydrolase